MSSTITQEALEQSMDVVLQRVHNDAYLQKLASLGHVPQDVAEAQDLLSLGFELEQRGYQVPETPTRSKYAAALSHLRGAAPTANSWDRAVMLAQDPAIYQAALTIKTAEAQVLAAEAEAEAKAAKAS